MKWIAYILISLSMIAAQPSDVASAPGRAAQTQNDRIFTEARNCLGKKMWSGYGLANGKLGCAAALSNVLRKAGYPKAHSATVTTLRRQLLALSGARELELKSGGDDLDSAELTAKARAGDILLAFMEPPTKLNGGPNAHCGIMGDGGIVFTNDWNDGIWKSAEYDQYFHYYQYVRLIRLQPPPIVSVENHR